MSDCLGAGADSSPQNKHWQRYAIHFSLDEVEVMERQLLALLDFDLRIDEVSRLKSRKIFSCALAKHPVAASLSY